MQIVLELCQSIACVAPVSWAHEGLVNVWKDLEITVRLHFANLMGKLLSVLLPFQSTPQIIHLAFEPKPVAK
jgi:hypothetical protein